MNEIQRICVIQKGENGFGFILCCENNTTDTYVLHVLKSSSASVAGLQPGDRIIEVNGVNVEKEEHKDVVLRLQGLRIVRLTVAHNGAAAEYFKKPVDGMTVKPLDACQNGLRPKLITVRRSKKGFDFALQTVGKTKRNDEEVVRVQLRGISGHYASKVREDGVAYKAGLRNGNRIIEINGVDIEQESHAFVIATIKSAAHIDLLVVDKDTDEFFQHHGVSPNSNHLTGKLELKMAPLQEPLYELCETPAEKYLEKPIVYTAGPTFTYTRYTFDDFPTPNKLHYSTKFSKLAMSTPNLPSAGLGRSKSVFLRDTSPQERWPWKKASRAKREIIKRFSKRDKKFRKPYLSKVDLSSSRKLYDETDITDDTGSTYTSSTSSSSQLEERFQSLTFHEREPCSPRISQSMHDLTDGISPMLKTHLPVRKERLFLNFESSECDSPPPAYESPDELATISFNVDLKTLKERVRKKSNRSKQEAVKAKKKLSDYSLAHMYVNSY